jgi:hypothetical protein
MRLDQIKTLFILAFILIGEILCAADYQLADLFDPLDPRLPGIKVGLLSRLEIANNTYHSLTPIPVDTSGLSGFNRSIADYLAKPSKYLLNYNNLDLVLQGDLRLKLNWLGLNEDNNNISNLQSAITAFGKATIKGKIDIVEEITAFRSDSTNNLSRASATGEFLNDPMYFYPPAWQGPIASDKNSFDFQVDRAFITTKLWGIELLTGRDRIQAKVGYRNGLLFSGLARPIDLFYKVDYRISRFDLMALSGQLTSSGKRFISTKRLGIRFAHNLYASVTEAVVFNDDASAYINPLMPIFITQRQRPNNDDNLLASIDISYTPVKNLNIYGEFLDDDLIVFGGGASKYGFMLGLYKSQMFSELLDFHIEYAQVRKWTYTHTTHINNWQYEGQSFGFWLGPDADELYSEFRYLFSPPSSVNLGFSYIRKGEGDLFHPYEDTFGDRTPKFPSGIVEKGPGIWFGGNHSLDKFLFTYRLGYRYVINSHNSSAKNQSVYIHSSLIYEL